MIIFRINDRKFALLGLREDGIGFGESGTRGGGDEVGGHYSCDRVGEVRMELNISGSYHTDEGGAKRAVLCSSISFSSLHPWLQRKSNMALSHRVEECVSAVR